MASKSTELWRYINQSISISTEFAIILETKIRLAFNDLAQRYHE